MAYKEDDIIYVLTKADVDDAARSIGLSILTPSHYRSAQKFVESFCGNGMYTWLDAIVDGLRDAEGELRGRPEVT